MEKCGAILKKPKVLDYCGAFAGAKIELPKEYTLPDNLIPDVRNQGDVNSCVGFSTTGIMQILNEIETGERKRFSAGYVYGKCRNDEDTYEGMVVDEALSHLIKCGSCYEEDFPINEEMPEIRKLVMARPELDDKAKPYHIKAYEVYASASKQKRYNDIKTALYVNNVPVLGVFRLRQGNHAVCIVGWNDNDKTFKILNSWGKEWGKNGVGNYSYDKLERGYLIMDAENSNRVMPFTDVDKNEWYYKAVQHAYNAGFMNGTSADTFEPNATLTRAELAQALVNFAKKIDETRG